MFLSSSGLGIAAQRALIKPAIATQTPLVSRIVMWLVQALVTLKDALSRTTVAAAFRTGLQMLAGVMG